jgi:hypothetical protein
MIENNTANPTTQLMNKEEYWAELHLELQDLLAGYLDGELTAQEISLVEAHLVGCQHCRNDLERQKALALYVEQIPIEISTIDLYEKTHQKILKENNAEGSKTKILASLITEIKSHIINLIRFPFSKQRFITASGWLVTAMLLIYLPFNTATKKNQETSSIPMIADALEQYYQLQSKDIPTTLNGINMPAKWKNISKLASWSTEIGGAPAQVFAVRYKDQIILQYKINESVFFRNAKVRQAIAKDGWYQDQSTMADILLLPKKGSGLIIVGPKSVLPKRELIFI